MKMRIQHEYDNAFTVASDVETTAGNNKQNTNTSK